MSRGCIRLYEAGIVARIQDGHGVTEVLVLKLNHGLGYTRNTLTLAYYSTARIPKALIHAVTQDLHHQQ